MLAYPPDASRPWWHDWQPWVKPVWHDWRSLALRGGVAAPRLCAVLNRHATQAPVEFVAQAALPSGQSYEGFIFERRQVPTRDNLHDLFNGCCWSRFPRTKARLNALQADVIDRQGVGATRGPLRDALTLFDENALLLQASRPLWNALTQHDWNTLLVAHRQDWCPAGLALQADTGGNASGPASLAVPSPPVVNAAHVIRPVVFGHALLEKLCQPYKSITAHAYWMDPDLPPHEEAWDAWLATRLEASHMVTKPFQPLPVMGIPGWCDANANPDFYADAQVFRPLPLRKSARA